MSVMQINPRTIDYLLQFLANLGLEGAISPQRPQKACIPKRLQTPGGYQSDQADLTEIGRGFLWLNELTMGKKYPPRHGYGDNVSSYTFRKVSTPIDPLQVIEVCKFIAYQIEDEYLQKNLEFIELNHDRDLEFEKTALGKFLKDVEETALYMALSEQKLHWGIPNELP